MCMFGVGREGVRMGKRVIGRTDAILILLYGDQTKGLSFNWTISTDHLSLRARLGQCYVQLHNRTVFVVIVFFGGVGDGGGGGGGGRIKWGFISGHVAKTLLQSQNQARHKHEEVKR